MFEYISEKDRHILTYIYYRLSEEFPTLHVETITQNLAYFANGFYLKKYKSPMFDFDWITSTIGFPIINQGYSEPENSIFYFYFTGFYYHFLKEEVVINRPAKEIIEECVKLYKERKIENFLDSYFYKYHKTSFAYQEKRNYYSSS